MKFCNSPATWTRGRICNCVCPNSLRYSYCQSVGIWALVNFNIFLTVVSGYCDQSGPSLLRISRFLSYHSGLEATVKILSYSCSSSVDKPSTLLNLSSYIVICKRLLTWMRASAPPPPTSPQTIGAFTPNRPV